MAIVLQDDTYPYLKLLVDTAKEELEKNSTPETLAAVAVGRTILTQMETNWGREL